MTKTMKFENTTARYTCVLLLLTAAACTTPPSKQESESSEQSQSQSQQSSSSSSSSSQSSPAQQQADPSSQQSTARAQQSSTSSASATQSSTSQPQTDPGDQDAAQGEEASTESASATSSDTTASASADPQQNPASSQQQSGQKSDDEILAEAMEVFNASIQSGRPDSGAQPQQGDSGTLDRTADGSAKQSGQGDTGPGSPATDQASAGSSTSGQISAATGSATGYLPPGQGSAGNLPSAAVGSGGQEGINTDMQGQRVIVLVPGSGAQTGTERVEALDRQLGEKMGEFDGVILSRRQEIIAKSNEDGAGDPGTHGGSGGGFGDGSGVESAPLLTASRDPNNMQTRGQLPDAPGDNRSGDYQGSGAGNANVPDDISDGSDDDIVARQLREAAIQEQDPELKEKLWDEYRKYKAGVQAKR